MSTTRPGGSGSLSSRVDALAVDTPILETERLQLTPLVFSNAAEMVEVLADERLYHFTGGKPPGLPELQARYLAQIAGPPAGGEVWHNWIIRLATSGSALGFVQATIVGNQADLAWLVAVVQQGKGIATEAAKAMSEWLIAGGTRNLLAHIHPEHAASGKVASALGLMPTGNIDSDGEIIWERRLPG